MSSTLTIRLDRKLEKMLKEESRESGIRRSDLVREALHRHLALRQFDRLRKKTLPYAKRAGFITDEDVFRVVSMRVFLDTNVLVSAFGTRGICTELVREVAEHHHLVVSDQVLSELRLALLRQFRMPADLVQEHLDFLAKYHVQPTPNVAPDFAVRDADDLLILAAAIAAEADVLVTGDKDLLAVAKQAPLRIVNLRGFLEMF